MGVKQHRLSRYAVPSQDARWNAPNEDPMSASSVAITVLSNADRNVALHSAKHVSRNCHAERPARLWCRRAPGSEGRQWCGIGGMMLSYARGGSWPAPWGPGAPPLAPLPEGVRRGERSLMAAVGAVLLQWRCR